MLQNCILFTGIYHFHKKTAYRSQAKQAKYISSLVSHFLQVSGLVAIIRPNYIQKPCVAQPEKWSIKNADVRDTRRDRLRTLNSGREKWKR